MDTDAGTNKVGEVRELGANQILDLDPIPLVADQQVLIGRKRLDALGEALDEIFGIFGGGLVSDHVHDAEHVLGAMIDFAQQEVLPLLALPSFGNVLHNANETHEPALKSIALKIGTPTALDPTHLSVPPQYPVLIRVGLRISGIERRPADRPKPFNVVRMHPL